MAQKSEGRIFNFNNFDSTYFGVGKPDRIFVEDFEEMRRNFVSREQDSGMLKFTNKKFASL